MNIIPCWVVTLIFIIPSTSSSQHDPAPMPLCVPSTLQHYARRAGLQQVFALPRSRDALHFDARVERKAGHSYGGTGRGLAWEELEVDFVERGIVGHVG